MKFSISKLEIARPDPVAFVKNLTEDSGYGYPKSLRWLDSVCEYHRTGNLSLAISFLQNKFSNRNRTAKNIQEEEILTKALINYVNEHQDLDYTHKCSRLKIDIYLNDKVEIGGLIWLVNTTSDGGFSTYTLTDADNIYWQNELRYPVIQNFLANKYKCHTEKVTVGIINYTTGIHQHTVFSEEHIRTSIEELYSIGNKMSSVL